MSYSKKYRERTIEYRQAGHSLEETHQVFKVSKSTIQKWEKQQKETGDLGKKELHRSFRKIDPEKLKAYVAEHPDAYQREMAEAFGCSESGIQDALRRHKNLFSIYLTFLECAIIVEEEGAERDEKKLSERHQPGTI